MSMNKFSIELLKSNWCALLFMQTAHSNIQEYAEMCNIIPENEKVTSLPYEYSASFMQIKLEEYVGICMGM